MRVVGCFLEYDGKFVLLRRLSHKPDGNSWGLPAGKVEDGETDEVAILRELFEETGYQAEISQLERLDEHRFSMPSGTVNDFIVFRVALDQPHAVILEERSHGAFAWADAREASAMELIHGLPEVFSRVGLLS